MEITILGSGGFLPTPLPNCCCENCKRARLNHKLAKTSTSFYIHDIDLLIDMPADSYHQVDKIGKFPQNVTYSHWHPDHTEGWRTLEFFNNTPNVYIPENSLILDRVPGLKFFESQGKIKVVNWNTETTMNVEKAQLSHFTLNKDIPVYGFILKDSEGKTAVIVPDHSKFLLNLELGVSPDLLIMSLGVQFSEKNATTLQDNIEVIKRMKPKQTILTHIEATVDLTEAQIQDLEQNYNATLAHDNQVI